MTAVIDNPTNVLDDREVKAEVRDENTNSLKSADTETPIELGIWFSGLESFLSVGHYTFRVRDAARPTVDFTIESRLTQSTLMRCMKLNARLLVEQNRNDSNRPVKHVRMLECANENGHLGHKAAQSGQAE